MPHALVNGTALPIIVWKVKYPLLFIVSYVQSITQQYLKNTLVIKVATMKS